MKNRKIFNQTVHSVLEQIDTPIALSIAIGLRYSTLVLPDVDPSNYLCAATYFADAQALALVKKNPWILPESDELSAVSLNKFLEAEDQCKRTNMTFNDTLKDFKVRSFLETVRHFVHRILGQMLFVNPTFGPGASFKVRGSFVNIVDKLRTLPECTPEMHETVMLTMLTHLPHYCLSSGLVIRDRGSLTLAPIKLPIVKGNRLAFVPKDLRGHRAICIEPLGNMLVQKGYGEAIRLRLKQWGLDLGKGYVEGLPCERQLIHRALAKQSSIDGINATIDLSSASDTISTSVVKFLLPQDWFDELDRCRSKFTELPDGSVIRNEKFSSMGNGFTFELESLIFYAFSLASRYHYGKPSDTVSVYGDDQILPSAYAQEHCQMLERAGFSINWSKSYLSGSFRESCGGDYLYGVDVRPVFLKDLEVSDGTSTIKSLFRLCNIVRKIAHRFGGDIFCDSRFNQSWRRVYHAIPVSVRVSGPIELGDDVLHMPRYEGDGWRVRSSDFITSVQRLVFTPIDRVKPTGGACHELAAALFGVSPSGVSRRNSRERIKKRYTAINERKLDCYTWR